MKRARIVIGSSYGDEGKGAVTDWLCSQGAGMVVRFNGGAQAGHTVVAPDGDRHVFHHCGSGTLLGVPTFLSQFFVCNPLVFLEEREELIRLGYHPEVYAHPDCIVTTYADMAINRIKEEGRADKRHGSCGLGIHETIQRSRVDNLKITMGDLWNGGTRLSEQLDEILSKWVSFRVKYEILFPDELKTHFIEACQTFAQFVNPLGIAQCQEPVFEGAQGLMLDQNNKDSWPHVTHSNTGMTNVNILCDQAGIKQRDIYYVSRTYTTRHGAGPLPGEDKAMSFHDDTNAANQWQGELRFAPQNFVSMHKRCARDAGRIDYKLVLTHCDQLPPKVGADYYFSGPTRNDCSDVWKPDAI